jgi:hypothetical protein
LLAAVGIQSLSNKVTELVSKLGRSFAYQRAKNATIVFLGVLFACNVFYFLPRQVQIYKNYSGMPRLVSPKLGNFIGENISGRYSKLHNALVVTDDWWIYTAYFAAMNCPKLDCDTVFAYAPNDEVLNDLKNNFKSRKTYVVKEYVNALNIDQLIN